MSRLPRLSGDLPAEFAAPLVDLARPIRFRIDDLTVNGFKGDSVLSALLGDGIGAVGTHGGSPVALDEASAPPVALAGNAHRPDLEMPMALCPALDGVHYVTTGKRRTSVPIKRLIRSLAGKASSLGHDLDGAAAQPGGWVDAAADETLAADVVIVGGGVAGLSAALEATRLGASVIIVEREAMIGGMSVFFGKADGEPSPDELVRTLSEKVQAIASITILTRAEAYDLSGTTLSLVQVRREAGTPRPVHISASGRAIILATGSREKLPVFAGNRLPGVVRSGFAWRMAARYGVWPGQSLHLHTTTAVGYRMALLGAGCGKTVHRSSDPRLAPQTRFIEFCKAHGFRLGWGARVAWARQRNGLEIGLCDTESGIGQDAAIEADQLVVSGGWQPDISLWLRNGGAVRWDEKRDALMPDGEMPAIVLAGSANGYRSLGGCAESGRAAARLMLKGKPSTVEDRLISELFESPDGPLPISAPLEEGRAPAYCGPVALDMLAPPKRRGLVWAFVRSRDDHAMPVPQAAHLEDIVGKIGAGQLAPGQAPAFCAQWAIAPCTFTPDNDTRLRPAVPGQHPDYLFGRFGTGARQWEIRPDGNRAFDPGCLIFANTDETDPLAAIGVIVSGAGTRPKALLARSRLSAGAIVYIRDGLTCTGARLDRLAGQDAGA